ncbi:MAG: GTP-binding protein [Oscillospiraceae bacterium]|nr:GTP-binding protein [Oscillospiraceae bacterium]
MTKVDIFSGFLGAGKTTLIKKLLAEAYKGEKLVLIENEFGDVSVDGGCMQDAGVVVNELNSGCICCSLVGDFTRSLQKVCEDYSPDRILIEPSGVGALSDIVNAVRGVPGIVINAKVCVADAKRAKVCIKNFGPFYKDQIANADAVILSRTDKISPEKLSEALALLRAENDKATIITTPWAELSGEQLLSAIESRDTLASELKTLAEMAEHDHEHHHHHHDEDEECCCHDHEHHHHHDEDEECHCHDHEHHHHHDEDEECHCHDHEHHHHHHDEDEECHCHDHEHHHHHHDEDEECSCGCGHHHHHDHEAADAFTSWGTDTEKSISEGRLKMALGVLSGDENVVRAKGYLAPEEGGEWYYFDLVPGEYEIRRAAPAVTGRLCVIGSHVNENAVRGLFGV